MREVPIYERDGSLCSVIHLEEDVEPLKGRRVSRSSRNPEVFYKGTGILYHSHFLDYTPNDEGYEFIKEKKAYECSLYRKKCFSGKFGIFKERYQPYFSDYIGACGPKEKNILKNTREMPDGLTNVEVLDYMEITKDISVIKLKYKETEEISENLDFKDLERFMRLIITSDFCIPRDKNIIKDLDCKCMVHDPADWFPSKKFHDKFGTVYQVISNLSANLKNFQKIFSGFHINLPVSKLTIPMLTIILINKYNNEILPRDELFSMKYTPEVCNKILEKYFEPCKLVKNLEEILL